MEKPYIIVVTPGFRTANSAAACKGKLTVGLCLAQRWNVNSVSSQRMSAAGAVSLTLARLTPFVTTSPKLAWMRWMWFASLGPLGSNMAPSVLSASARMATSVAQWTHSAFRNCEVNCLTGDFCLKNVLSLKRPKKKKLKLKVDDLWAAKCSFVNSWVNIQLWNLWSLRKSLKENSWGKTRPEFCFYCVWHHCGRRMGVEYTPWHHDPWI